MCDTLFREVWTLADTKYYSKVSLADFYGIYFQVSLIKIAILSTCQIATMDLWLQIVVNKFVVCLCRNIAILWRLTWSLFSKMKSVMGCVSAGTYGPPADWRPQEWLSHWPVY